MKNSEKRLYIFIGAPGSGKGSVSALCVEQFGWKQISTGNICRQEISNQSEIGKMIDFVIKSGKLVPDELIARMVGEELARQFSLFSDIILDGFPRTLAQAQALDALLSENEFAASFAPEVKIVRFAVDDDVVLGRLNERLLCSQVSCQAVYSQSPLGKKPISSMKCDVCSALLKRRVDDDESVIRERLITYRVHECDLLGYYSRRINNQLKSCADAVKFFNVSAELPLEDVFVELKRVLDLDS